MVVKPGYTHQQETVQHCEHKLNEDMKENRVPRHHRQ